MQTLRLQAARDATTRSAAILHELRRAAPGLRDAYVGDGLPARPAAAAACRSTRPTARNYIVAFAMPWVWVVSPEDCRRAARI